MRREASTSAGSGSASSTAPAAKQAIASIQKAAWVLPASPITAAARKGPRK